MDRRNINPRSSSASSATSAQDRGASGSAGDSGTLMKRSYVVSGLSPDHKNQKPITDARYFPGSEELGGGGSAQIFIPSVSSLPLWGDDSPRSVNTDQSAITWNSGNGPNGTSPLPGSRLSTADGNPRFSPTRLGLAEDCEEEPDTRGSSVQNSLSLVQHSASDVLLPKALQGGRLPIESNGMYSLSERFGLDAHQSLGGGGGSQSHVEASEHNTIHMNSTINLDRSGMSEVLQPTSAGGAGASRSELRKAKEKIEHYSSGDSVNLFENKNFAADAHMWGSGRTMRDLPVSSGLWGSDEAEGYHGTTMEALERIQVRERKAKEIEFLTSQLKPAVDADGNWVPAPAPATNGNAQTRTNTQGDPFTAGDMDDSDEDLSLKGHSVVEDYMSLDASKTSGDGKPENPLTRPASSSAHATEAEEEERRHHQEEEEEKNVGEHSEMVVSKKRPPKLFESKTRESLKNLGSYVYGHTNRKIMLAWTPIESRFIKSTMKKVEMVKDASGLSHPHKRPALYLSALTGLLCSSSIRCTWQELSVLYGNFNCSRADVIKSRKLAAIKVVLGPNQGTGLRQRDELMNEMSKLMEDEEMLISLEQLKDAVFPEDPKERAKELASLESEKAAYISQMVAEKEKRDAMTKAVESRKAKMISDLDESFAEIQFPKGTIHLAKLKTMKELGAYLATSYRKKHAQTDVKVSDELVQLLGLECFPDCVHRATKCVQNTQNMRTKLAMKNPNLRRLSCRKKKTSQFLLVLRLLKLLMRAR